MKKIAINGLGRIGRSFFRMAFGSPDFQIVALNDLSSPENLAYLLKHDSVYKETFKDVFISSDGNAMIVDGTEFKLLNEKEPEKLPWKELGIDLVVECTGVFTSYELSKAHLKAGAKKVVISAPVKDEPADVTGATVLMGINEDKLKVSEITSNASCTTNASGIPLKILNEEIGIEKAIISTAHAYTASQPIVDTVTKKGGRRGRAGAQNIIPTTTGAAIATTKALPGLKDRFDGVAIRVPVIAGSLLDLTFIAKRNVTVEEINNALVNGAADKRFNKYFAVTDEELVSSDIIGEKYAGIADLLSTRVVGGNLVKVFVWYDNETGYTHTLLQHVKEALME